jgi:hypothetical protein
MKERVVGSSELKDALVALGVNHPMHPERRP